MLHWTLRIVTSLVTLLAQNISEKTRSLLPLILRAISTRLLNKYTILRKQLDLKIRSELLSIKQHFLFIINND